jgi:RHS repeat-associated protein
MQAWGYSGDARTLPKTRVWGSEPENLHCSSATAPLKIELRWGCEESSGKTAVGSGVSFKYDPFGRRIYKSSSAATSIYAYDGDNLVEETNSSGTAVARYSQGLKIDEPLAMPRGSTTSYYQADGLGSVTSLSSGTGTLAQTYGYDSFGKQTSSSGSLTNTFQYAARELDPETNLYFNRNRYYDPNVGRFVNEDPVRFDAGQNFYRYVRNNPPLLIDPTGLLEILPADPTINTVVCNGHGGMRIQIGMPRSSPLQEKCTEDCIKAHEGSHLADDTAANPKICKGKAKGAVIGFSNPDEQKVGEIKAYTAELDCLNNKKLQHFCKDCFQPLMDAIQNAGDRINAFKNGTN